MKRSSFLLCMIALMLLTACGNGQKRKKTGIKDIDTIITQQYLTDDLLARMDSLVESFNAVSAFPVFEKGTLNLTDKEKMVKPDYLMPLKMADEMVTLQQKYSFLMMIASDKVVAEKYGMPLDNYQAVISKLLLDINDAALNDGIDGLTEENAKEFVTKVFRYEKERGTLNFFWQGITAALVEQIYILTQNIDKLMVNITDKNAEDICYNFVLVHQAIEDLIPYHPEMGALNSVMLPLYDLNAATAPELRKQLLDLKGDIELVRTKIFE